MKMRPGLAHPAAQGVGFSVRKVGSVLGRALGARDCLDGIHLRQFAQRNHRQPSLRQLQPVCFELGSGGPVTVPMTAKSLLPVLVVFGVHARTLNPKSTKQVRLNESRVPDKALETAQPIKAISSHTIGMVANAAAMK
jgi:hypothetical protein